MEKTVKRQYTHPTLGETIKYLFDATGISGNKDLSSVKSSSLHELNSKTLFKKLNRLAEETGSLQPQLQSLLDLYTDELRIYVTCPVMQTQIAELLNDLYRSYRESLKQFSTYMSRSATVRYLLTSFVVRCCVVSWQANALATSAAKRQPLPHSEPFWFLPYEEEGRLVSPLHKSLQWAYEICGVTRAQFHRPTGVTDPSGQLTRNLDTSRKWKWVDEGKPPSLPALYRNLAQSFDALEQAGNPVAMHLRQAIVTNASVARFTSYIAHSIESAYGRAFLLDTCNQIKLYAGWLSPHLETARAEGARLAESYPIPELTTEQARSHYAVRVFGTYLEKCSEANTYIQANRGDDGVYSPQSIERVENLLGAFAAFMDQDITSRWALDKPEDFDELMAKAITMRQAGSTTLNDIDALEGRMKKAGVADRVPWVLHWLRGVVFYRADQFENAAEQYIAAFQLARYSAGDYQYLLMNQYLEAMAKTNRWLQFKQGAYWADYLGLKVRHLRDRELTEENIRFAFTLLGMHNAKYYEM